MKPIREFENLTARQFHEEILPAGQPAVLRGLVSSWPIVSAGRQSASAFCDYLRRFDRGYEVDTAYGPPSTRGRMFYNEDLSGLNTRISPARLSASLDYLVEHASDDPAPLLAVQSLIIDRYLPGLQQENCLPADWVPDGTEPRLWLGGRATIAAHYDPSENIACCVAGRRRFTLFAPDQVQNLYVGPFELTPAGATISMVDFDRPDDERYPRFREAEASALTAELRPGDAIYVPYLWWHHVRSLDAVNGLVNYWWSRVPDRAGDPRNALLHAMVCLRDMPASYRAGWKALFDHYVFEDPAVAGSHLPENRRGILGKQSAEAVRRLKQALSKALGRN